MNISVELVECILLLCDTKSKCNCRLVSRIMKDLTRWSREELFKQLLVAIEKDHVDVVKRLLQDSRMDRAPP